MFRPNMDHVWTMFGLSLDNVLDMLWKCFGNILVIFWTSLVFIRQALQLHANINLRERKLASLRTKAEKYLKLIPIHGVCLIL